MKSIRLILLVSLLVLSSTSASAQFAEEWAFGLRTGIYVDQGDPFIGVEGLTPLYPGWFFNPNVEWVFIDGGDFATINLDIHYDLDLETDYYVWVGGGLAGLYENLGDSEFDLGANILGGIGWHVDTWLPYAQVKVLVSDVNDEVVGAVGVRF